MKLAALISGEPRFCEEFDRQLSNFTNFHTIDWYFYLWENNEAPHHTKIDVVSPFWKQIQHHSALSKLKSLLPTNHNIIELVVADKEQHKIKFKPKNVSFETNAENTWLKFNGFYHVNQLRKKHNIEYDFVIMTRPDICMEQVVDFSNIKEKVDLIPTRIPCVVVPNNWAHGYGRKICDNFAVAKPEVMDIYCDLINKIPEFQQENFIFHPESMLAEHLHRQGVHQVLGDFSIQLRYLGKKDPERVYISNFGRWT